MVQTEYLTKTQFSGSFRHNPSSVTKKNPELRDSLLKIANCILNIGTLFTTRRKGEGFQLEGFHKGQRAERLGKLLGCTLQIG